MKIYQYFPNKKTYSLLDLVGDQAFGKLPYQTQQKIGSFSLDLLILALPIRVSFFCGRRRSVTRSQGVVFFLMMVASLTCFWEFVKKYSY